MIKDLDNLLLTTGLHNGAPQAEIRVSLVRSGPQPSVATSDNGDYGRSGQANVKRSTCRTALRPPRVTETDRRWLPQRTGSEANGG